MILAVESLILIYPDLPSPYQDPDNPIKVSAHTAVTVSEYPSTTVQTHPMAPLHCSATPPSSPEPYCTPQIFNIDFVPDFIVAPSGGRYGGTVPTALPPTLLYLQPLQSLLSLL